MFKRLFLIAYFLGCTYGSESNSVPTMTSTRNINPSTTNTRNPNCKFTLVCPIDRSLKCERKILCGTWIGKRSSSSTLSTSLTPSLSTSVTDVTTQPTQSTQQLQSTQLTQSTHDIQVVDTIIVTTESDSNSIVVDYTLKSFLIFSSLFIGLYVCMCCYGIATGCCRKLPADVKAKIHRLSGGIIHIGNSSLNESLFDSAVMVKQNNQNTQYTNQTGSLSDAMIGGAGSYVAPTFGGMPIPPDENPRFTSETA